MPSILGRRRAWSLASGQVDRQTDRVRWAGDNSLLLKREILHLEKNLRRSALSPGGCRARRGREGCAGGLLSCEPAQAGQAAPLLGEGAQGAAVPGWDPLPHRCESGCTGGMLGRKLGLVPAAHPPCSSTRPPAMASTIPMLGTRAGVIWKVLPDPNDHQPPTAQQFPSLHMGGRVILAGCGAVGKGCVGQC